jgi:hypothetical protein
MPDILYEAETHISWLFKITFYHAVSIMVKIAFYFIPVINLSLSLYGDLQIFLKRLKERLKTKDIKMDPYVGSRNKANIVCSIGALIKSQVMDLFT